MKNILFLCSLLALAVSCNKAVRTVPPEQRKQQQEFQAQQEAIDKLARATEEKFKKMSVPELLVELERAAANGREPFNAPAFREILTRKEAAEPLFRSIVTPSQKEYFKLMALKKLAPASYAKIPAKQGAAILTDALAKSVTFNAWGIPNQYWESSAKAIIDYGADAVPELEKLLADQRPAPVWGSEEAMIYERYKFRVCDYAFALLNEIRRRKVELPVAPAERDALIASHKSV
jgi:hypothetical protein